MLLHQEAGDLVGVATLGSAAARLPDAWVPYLLGVQRLLVAYDTDAAGAEGAAMWEAVTSRVQRLLPLAGKDVTDFYLAGGDLRAWVQFALAGESAYNCKTSSDGTSYLASAVGWAAGANRGSA